MILDHLDKEIKQIRKRFGLSLAQFGSLVGAPAITVKRWEEGRSPQKRFVFQTILVLGLIDDAQAVYFDLGRQGIKLSKEHWDSFSGLVTSAQKSIDTAKELGFAPPKVDDTLVSGVMGLLSLISTAFAAENNIGARMSSSIATRIAEFLN